MEEHNDKKTELNPNNEMNDDSSSSHDGKSELNDAKTYEMKELYINNNEPDNSHKSNRETCLKRYCSQLEPGSLRSSIFSLSILSIGIGSLALPQKFGQISVLFTVIIIFISSIAGYITLDVLTNAGRKNNLSVYADVVKFYCGPKWQKAFDIVNLLNIFGIILAYQIVNYKMISAFCYAVIPSLNSQYVDVTDFFDNSIFSKVWFKICLMEGIALCFLFPLNLMRDVSKLRFSTVFGLIAIFIVAIVLIIQLPLFINEYWTSDYFINHPEYHINWFNIGKAFNENLDFFSGTATIFFACAVHHGMFPVYDKLADHSKRRTRKVIFRSCLLNCVFYVIIGIVGYLTQPINTPDIIIERKSLKNDPKDILLTICRLLVAFMLIVKIPMNYNPMRLSIFNLFFGTTNITTKR